MHNRSRASSPAAKMRPSNSSTSTSRIRARTTWWVDPNPAPAVVGLLDCGVMAGLGAAMNTGNVSRGDSVAVIGCGGVGDVAIAGARLVRRVGDHRHRPRPEKAAVGNGIGRHLRQQSASSWIRSRRRSRPRTAAKCGARSSCSEAAHRPRRLTTGGALSPGGLFPGRSPAAAWVGAGKTAPPRAAAAGCRESGRRPSRPPSSPGHRCCRWSHTASPTRRRP